MHRVTEKEENSRPMDRPASMTTGHNQIKQVIGVMSGKGGVGKSFVSGLLACGLAREGYQVGMLDADYTGSSIPSMFGLHGPAKAGQYSFLPLQSDLGVKIISLNSVFEDQDQSIIWKASLVGEVINTFWREVEWGVLDYLIIDMPPATSEVAVAVMQSLPFKGVIMVTTPQALSTEVVKKAVYSVQKCDVPIIGVVENMAYYLDPNIGEKRFIFGQSSAEAVAEAAHAPLLAQLPLDAAANRLCDAGNVEQVMLDEYLDLQGSLFSSLSLLDQKELSRSKDAKSDTLKSPSSSSQAGAEDDLVSGASPPPQADAFPSPYSDIVMYLIRSRENMGVLDHPDAQGFFTGSCGDRMQIDLRIIDGRIMEAKFLAEGCGVTAAAGSMITKMACTKTVEEAEKITPALLITALGGLPDDHLHCADLAVMTLRDACIDAVEGFGKPLNK